MVLSGISYIWIFNIRNNILRETYDLSIKIGDLESLGIEEIKEFSPNEREEGYFIFKSDGKRVGIKFKGNGRELLRRIEKTRSGLTIASFSILAIFILSIPFLLFPLRKKALKPRVIEEDVFFSLSEMLSKLRIREEELIKGREEEKKKAEEFRMISHVIFNSLQFPILLLSPDNKILNMNRAGEEFFGKSVISSLYKSASSIFSPKFLEIVDDVNKKCVSEDRIIYENEKWLLVQVTPVKGERGIIGSIFMLQDITDRKRNEEILKEKDKMASLGEMASYLAHEIKNSISVALGYLKLSSEKEDYTERTVKELNIISSNIERFLDFARPLKIKKERIEIKEIISEVMENFEGIEISFEGDFPQFQGDKNLLKIVFFNLIKNSTEAESSHFKIRSYWKNGDRNIVIDLIDDGTGISRDEVDKVFLPFFSKKEGGAGLGLPLSKKIILHHGGEIKIIPSEKGTTVRITLPAQ